MKKLFKGIANYFKDFGTAIAKGDIWTKLSLLIMGAGYAGRKQYVKAVLVTLVQAAIIAFTCIFSLPNLSKLFSHRTLDGEKLTSIGKVVRETTFDPYTFEQKTNNYDNSLLILIMSIVGILVIIAFVFFWIQNIKVCYNIQKLKEEGRHVNSFREDMKTLVNEKFHITLLTIPSLGVILINVIPILFMIAIAFTNYNQYHQPPANLLDWVKFENFKSLFTNSQTITFGYAFVRILIWTLVWAVLATLTTYIGGILLAKLINNKDVRGKKVWRSLFVITIGIPQFVTLLLISKMFGNYGIVNSLCKKAGIIEFLKSMGILGNGATYIPFLSKSGWAHAMIIIVNIWVGVPYQMLIATGILMNIPADQLESARIDGATDRQIFWKITMPYMLFITGPSLITSVISNINNFNVIYLLTNGYVTSNMKYASSNAKEVDLLITWLFTLTTESEKKQYNMASVIGIITFVVCALITLLSYTRMIKGDKEEEFQ